MFQAVLPQIVFSLQNIEFFHHAEKRLLVARGLLESATVRQITMVPSLNDDAHIDFLNQQILETLDSLGLPRNPERVEFE